MSKFALAVVLNLREEMQVRIVEGKNYSAPVELATGGEVRLHVDDMNRDNQLYRLVVSNDMGAEIASALVLDNTCQIFRTLGLMVHLKML